MPLDPASREDNFLGLLVPDDTSSPEFMYTYIILKSHILIMSVRISCNVAMMSSAHAERTVGKAGLTASEEVRLSYTCSLILVQVSYLLIR
jgi:hypothetical protein